MLHLLLALLTEEADGSFPFYVFARFNFVFVAFVKGVITEKTSCAAYSIIIIIIIIIMMKKNFTRRSFHGHHSSKRRELEQHAFAHTLQHSYSHVTFCEAPAQLLHNLESNFHFEGTSGTIIDSMFERKSMLRCMVCMKMHACIDHRDSNVQPLICF